MVAHEINFGLSSGYRSILSSIEVILKQATKAIKIVEVVIVKWPQVVSSSIHGVSSIYIDSHHHILVYHHRC